jgi:hypothetical protein
MKALGILYQPPIINLYFSATYSFVLYLSAVNQRLLYNPLNLQSLLRMNLLLVLPLVTDVESGMHLTSFGPKKYSINDIQNMYATKDGAYNLLSQIGLKFTISVFNTPNVTIPELSVPVNTGNIGQDARNAITQYKANRDLVIKQQAILVKNWGAR